MPCVQQVAAGWEAEHTSWTEEPSFQDPDHYLHYLGEILLPVLCKKSGQLAVVVLAGLRASQLAVSWVGAKGQISHKSRNGAKGRERNVKCSDSNPKPAFLFFLRAQCLWYAAVG